MRPRHALCWHMQMLGISGVTSNEFDVDGILLVATVSTLVAALPGFKVGGSWRFKRSEIEKWIKQQMKAKQEDETQ